MKRTPQVNTALPESPAGLLAALGAALSGPGQVRSRATDRLALGHDASHFALTPSVVATPVDGTEVGREGCLSIPEYYEEVERPARVKVRYLDLDSKVQEIEADGLLATCLQHEIDHLNGVLFIDHISKLKRDRVIKKFTKQLKHADKRAAE